MVIFMLQPSSVAKFVRSYVAYVIKPNTAPVSKVLVNDSVSIPGTTTNMSKTTMKRA